MKIIGQVCANSRLYVPVIVFEISTNIVMRVRVFAFTMELGK